jgi:PAS domain S-box-containing protein/putative nucleotidyltransferase with HDIG domain
VQAFDATRRQAAESDLRESEERFQRLFNASPDGVVVIDSNGRIRDANWAQARMYGHDSPDDLIGVKATLLVAPSCRAYSAQIMQRRLSGEEIPPVEYELVRKDGSTFYGETLATILQNPDGTVSGYICTTRDTTERRRAEAALWESEKRYRDLFDGAAEGIFRSSLEGKVLSNNEAMAQMLGYDSAGEVITEVVDSARQIWADPDERSRFTKLLQEQGIARGYECQFLRKDGNKVWVSLNTRFVPASDSGPAYYEGFIEDITKRKQTEDLLRRSEQNYKLMFESAPLAINVTHGTEISYANPSYLEMFGFSSLDELRARPAIELFAPEWRSRILENIQRRVEGLSVPDTCEAECLRRDGTKFPVLMQYARAEFADGPATVAFLTDITERKRAEEERREHDLQFRTFVEQAPVAITVTRDGVCLYANQRLAEMFGRENVADLVGRPVHEFFPPGMQKEDQERRQNRSRGLAVPTVNESVVLRADGSQLPVQLAEGSVQLRDGSAYIAFISDITERRRVEQVAKERAHFLEELLDAIPVPVHYKDVTLRYVGCNEAFAAFLGRSRDDIIGKTVFDVNSAELAKRFDASDRELLVHPEQPIEDEVELPGPEGTLLHILTHKAAFSDVAGKPAGIIGVNLDVTEMRRAEQELVASAEQLALTLEGSVAALGATTELRDPYTAGHQRRVAELACAIGFELGWNETRLKSLRIAAVLHDIGKIVLPAEILAKPGRLNETEMQLIRQHAAAGAEIVGAIGFERNVAEIIRQHHERLDGSGYPEGLRDGEILAEARILAVADVVEAMISHRPYRPALPIEAAMTELEKGAGTRYDAETCEIAMELIRERGFTFTK